MQIFSSSPVNWTYRSLQYDIFKEPGHEGTLANKETPLANRRWVIAGLIVLLIALGGLLFYKSTGSIATVESVRIAVAPPTFFEIPLGILLLQMGAPGAAAAMLFAGPIINMPSLFILAQQTNPKVSILLALGIWLLAMGAGLAVSL